MTAVGKWLARCAPATLNDLALRFYHGQLLYLDRYWREEKQVCDDLLAQLASGTTRFEMGGGGAGSP